ncbi:hypothetical protein PHJA_002677300 [Phtheirospermum japonicum]|uniref:Uncharacterized protein n=1 Tax=Phtheirospermum japonicum TaxID=374723 RepID=A0A830DGW1_9LAMI|nr:hypothetical protein PHJA_002677300 [Phtheirospermum japonicum]
MVPRVLVITCFVLVNLIHFNTRSTPTFFFRYSFKCRLCFKEKGLIWTLDLDKERKDRSMEEMDEEADSYRKLLS